MILGLELMSFHKNSFQRIKSKESNILGFDLISINCVVINILFFIIIALSRIKVCRCVRLC